MATTQRAIGLYGGSFDPIHVGHIAPVRAAREALGLERVLYLPTGRPPHKPDQRFAPAARRFAMVELALLDEPGLEAMDWELRDDRPSYTADTLARAQQLFPDAALHLLIGADSACQLHRWRRWQEIPRRATVVVLARPGWQLDDDAAMPIDLRTLLALDDDRPPLPAGWRPARRVTNPEIDVASSTLRRDLAAGRTPDANRLPRAVLYYIDKYQLYRSNNRGEHHSP
ncbi:MAG: nicotinate (nicotinamide) nucleotide adenylyltransferase [Acidobacteriota bacterium]